MSASTQLVSLKEKIGYALGDGAANIAWRGVSTFLFIFYTDVFGLNPAVVGLLMLITRFSDGITDVLMGIAGDRTHTRYGMFRPWILWTALPLGAILSLLFTAPDLSPNGKIVYAYATYILFTLVYTANNIPYGALMAVMSGDDRERTSIGSFRMVGAFGGGMLVQGILLYLVLAFGNVHPTIEVHPSGPNQFQVQVSAAYDVAKANISTRAGIAQFALFDADSLHTASPSKSFAMQAHTEYRFLVTGVPTLQAADIGIIDQQRGYSHAIYLLSVFLTVFMILTFLSTRERVAPPTNQQTHLLADLRDLLRNRPWLVLLLIGLLFNVYNSIKQGIVVIYFSHYLHQQLLAASYMVGLMLASIAGAAATAPLSRRLGKRALFAYALMFSGVVNALLYFLGPQQTQAIFVVGILSEFAAAALPTLFFTMLGDAADYSEWKNGRRATGLVYSAGSFASKFGSGVAGGIIGGVLAAYGYDGTDASSIPNAQAAIVMLMSWIPALIAFLSAAVMRLYPLNQALSDRITAELAQRRQQPMV